MIRNEFAPFEEKMRADGQSAAAISAFESNFRQLLEGGSGLIAEGNIEPADGIALYEDWADCGWDRELLQRTAILKLNGGLGTGMGLDRAKSLIAVKDGRTFLDLFLAQVDWLKSHSGNAPRVVLMNSFSTDADTRDFLQQRGVQEVDMPWMMMQSRVPKVDADSLSPVCWPSDVDLEWCPPGHGDIYATLSGSGVLQRLLEQGVEYLFVSNSDNLGAALDARILAGFVASGAPFLMEVAKRTEADRKGGHLARRKSDGRLILRESAQCAADDKDTFQDVTRHRYFNTNNIWLRLSAVVKALEENRGALPLPMIRNVKTVDPKDEKSTKVYQLETAMGSAIELFDGAMALCVPRRRFAPVKSTADLLVLRSDACRLAEDGTLALAAERRDKPPLIVWEDAYYKKLADYEQRIPPGAEPSLLGCEELKIIGDTAPASGSVFTDKVVLGG